QVSLFESTEAAFIEGDLTSDFSATWRGSCKMVKPFFHSFVEKYPNVAFIENDVVMLNMLPHGVKCLLTFQFYKKHKLEETIKHLK
uniref:Thioredoxin domain-containing protein n=1 Tax=Salvator merianae TaxID=96440 RepID=A0A8D0BS27_SALMN